MKCKCAYCGETTTQSRKKANDSNRVFCDRECKNRYMASDDRTKDERWNYLIAVLIYEGEIDSKRLKKEYFPEVSTSILRRHMRKFRETGLVECHRENKGKPYRYTLPGYMQRNLVHFESRNKD